MSYTYRYTFIIRSILQFSIYYIVLFIVVGTNYIVWKYNNYYNDMSKVVAYINSDVG